MELGFYARQQRELETAEAQRMLPRPGRPVFRLERPEEEATENDGWDGYAETLGAQHAACGGDDE